MVKFLWLRALSQIKASWAGALRNNRYAVNPAMVRTDARSASPWVKSVSDTHKRDD